MPDFPALDVAIGLVFLYVILALVCTTINETISTIIGLRARFLQLGLINLLSAAPYNTEAGFATVKQLYAHPLVQGLIRPGRGPDPSLDPTKLSKWFRRSPYPSYLPSRTFVAAITDIAAEAPSRLGDAEATEGAAALERMKRASEDLERSLASIPNTKLSEALLALYRSAGREADDFNHALEEWFDDSMERVSGWYKRRVQLILAIIGTLVVCALNADSLAAGRVLWRDDAVRAAVVKQAEQASQQEINDVELEEAVKQLDLPLGWTGSFGDEPTQLPNDFFAWLAKIAGLAMTIGAVMLGAPFWFDLLSKVMRVRSTGAPPPASDARRTGEAEEPRAGPQRPKPRRRRPRTRGTAAP